MFLSILELLGDYTKLFIINFGFNLIATLTFIL